MRPPHDLHPDLAPPVSTLAVVEERFRPQEADELKKRLGTSLVSKLEDMHRELALLISIYTEYRLETEQSRSRSFDLIESTFQRDMVLDKIQMLLVKLKNGASETETQDSSIVKYVLASEKTKRPRQFVARPSSRLNDNELDRIFHTIDRVEDPLALLEMDVVVDELRDILLEEQHALASHIACLYDDIDNERAIRCNTAELSCLSSPSMQELIKFSEKLELQMSYNSSHFSHLPSMRRLDPVLSPVGGDLGDGAVTVHQDQLCSQDVEFDSMLRELEELDTPIPPPPKIVESVSESPPTQGQSRQDDSNRNVDGQPGQPSSLSSPAPRRTSKPTGTQSQGRAPPRKTTLTPQQPGLAPVFARGALGPIECASPSVTRLTHQPAGAGLRPPPPLGRGLKRPNPGTQRSLEAVSQFVPVAKSKIVPLPPPGPAPPVFRTRVQSLKAAVQPSLQRTGIIS